MGARLIEILFGAYRRKILGLLLLRPEERFHVREIARMLEIPAGTLHRELRALAEGELLLRRKSGNQVYYQANRECPVYSELAGLFRKTSGLADVIRAAMDPLERIEVAFVFGSVARGEEQAGSDIDLFVLGELSFAEVVGALAEVHQQLGREINPVVMTTDTFRQKAASDPFVMRLIDDMKIYVRGTEHDFRKLVGDRTA